MAVNDQKLRILYLMQIMLSETDEEHILNASDLIRILKQKYDMEADRRTIYSDMDVLDRFGINIVQVKGRTSGYYVADRQFELPELKVLVDAVQSSRFITEKKSRELIGKLSELCSRPQAQQLAKQVAIYNRSKTSNETIYYNVDYIHSAIFHNKKITFQYGEWTPKKEFRPKKDGAFYVVSPWSLNWDEEKYYLIAYDEQADKMKHYRVDKMQKMSILPDDRVGEAAFKDFNPVSFSKKTFGMYGGEDKEVTLICANELAGVVIDRFGQNIFMMPADEDHFKVRVPVTVSRQFYGWMAGIGSKLRITEPEEVKSGYINYLKEILDVVEL